MQAAIAPRVTDSQLSTFELKHLIKKTNASRETMNNSIAFHSSVDVLQTVRIIAAEIWTWVAGWEPNSIYTPAGKQKRQWNVQCPCLPKNNPQLENVPKSREMTLASLINNNVNHPRHHSHAPRPALTDSWASGKGDGMFPWTLGIHCDSYLIEHPFPSLSPMYLILRKYPYFQDNV